MSNVSTVTDFDAITECVNRYIDGSTAGKGDMLRPSFHSTATIYAGGEELAGGPIEGLFKGVDSGGEAKGLTARLTSVDIVGHAASARLDIDNWNGKRYTDFFNLVKVDGSWIIVSKVYHTHG